MVQSSYESRWFFRGPVPGAVVDAFWTVQAWRSSVDHPDRGWPTPGRHAYLAFSPDMGLKVRDEPKKPTKLEFKGLVSRHGPVVFGDRVIGFAEDWVKWSYEGETVPKDLSAVVASGTSAVVVVKRRVMRKIRLDLRQNDEEVDPNDPDVRVDRGLQLELTTLELPGRKESEYWTLSFEAFSVDANLREDVHRNAGPFLEEIARAGSLDLGLGNSYSYPMWLLHLRAPSQPVDRPIEAV